MPWSLTTATAGKFFLSAFFLNFCDGKNLLKNDGFEGALFLNEWTSLSPGNSTGALCPILVNLSKLLTLKNIWIGREHVVSRNAERVCFVAANELLTRNAIFSVRCTSGLREEANQPGQRSETGRLTHSDESVFKLFKIGNFCNRKWYFREKVSFCFV